MKPIMLKQIKYIPPNYRIPIPKKFRKWVRPLESNTDIFIRPKEVDLKVKLLLCQYPQMDLNAYRRLSEPEKKLLRLKVKYLPSANFNDKADVDDVIALSHIIIDNLDKTYGKDKYVFCSIGKSPALFANVLEAMGIESKICRYSARKDLCKFHFCNNRYQQTYDEYKAYLNHLGLDSKTIKNSDKTYVFVDYVMGGRNLKTFQEIIEDPTIGLKLDNVKFENMNKFFYNENGVDENSHKYLKYMEYSTFKPYAIVPLDKSIPFIKRQYSHVQNKPWSDEIKLFRFALFDKILGS